MRSTVLRCILLILLGFLTFPLLEILPVAGGGASIIILVTIPFIILVALILTLIYNVYYVKKKDRNVQDKAFLIMIFIILILNVLLFPHK